MVRRGLLFAPVYFERVVYTQPSFVYTPVTVVNTTVITQHFFVRPNYGQYYFGDYYAPNYAQRGIVPWFAFQERRVGYNPIFAQRAAVDYRGVDDPDERVQMLHEFCRGFSGHLILVGSSLGGYVSLAAAPTMAVMTISRVRSCALTGHPARLTSLVPRRACEIAPHHVASVVAPRNGTLLRPMMRKLTE